MPLANGDFLPCQRSNIGRSPCNPSWDVAWPASVTDSRNPPPGWCKDGHEGRLCSKCSRDYYGQGQDCARFATAKKPLFALIRNDWHRCPGPAVRWIVGLVYVLGGVFIAGFLYWRSMRADASKRGQSALAPILLLHLQQLSAVISSQAAFASWVVDVVSTASSAAGFSLQSLLAIECTLALTCIDVHELACFIRRGQ